MRIVAGEWGRVSGSSLRVGYWLLRCSWLSLHGVPRSYVKVPHRAANVLEPRLGEVASLVAGRPVQVRCEDFSNGEIVEPGGALDLSSGPSWP
jgi:hypothetical protein